MTISVLMPVALSVDAYLDENGDVQIEGVRNYVGLPSVTEIYEAMDSDDFDALNKNYESAP